MQTERAIDELRRQMGIIIAEANGHAMANYPVEFLDETLFTRLRGPSLCLLLTSARAKTLNLPAQDTKIEAHGLSLAELKTLADPTADTVPLPALQHRPASAIDSMTLQLAKYAGLLPALLVANTSEVALDWLTLSADELRKDMTSPETAILQTAQASLPIEGAEKATLFSFRSRHATAVHLALVIGDIDAHNPPLTRIHSACVTGDLLGSLRCDCGDQLKLALAEICHEGNGILIYLHQEGRGIGITNKLRSYALQERGIDTFTANLMLGFEEDERDFSIASAILQFLKVGTIRMLTNNPHKLSALEKAGIRVSERVPLISAAKAHNQDYLKAKAHKAGHLF